MTDFSNLKSNGVPVGCLGMGKATPELTVFVDGRTGRGDDGASGRSITSAYATIQKAIDVVNVAAYLYKDVDIIVKGGYYEETLRFKKDHLSGIQNLWTNGGSNTGGIGKIRVIAQGCVFLEGGTSATAPTITIERCNVEFHDFEMIYYTTTEDDGAGEWTLPDGNSVSGFAMPCVYVGDDWNNDTLTGAASNKVLFSNCRINAGTGAIAFMNHGAKHIYVVNCILEYGEYGCAFIGSSKGSGAECFIDGCTFNQCSTAGIYFQAQITNVIKNCLFMNDAATDAFAGGSGCSYNWIDNCAGLSEDHFEAAGSSGIDATRIYTSTDGGPVGSTNLTTDTWKTGVTTSS